MKRSVSAALVVLVAILLAVAQPAAAASGQLAVASSHTSASDFNGAATLDNVSVVGSGDSAYVELSGETTIDGFEDQDISDWNGQDDGGTTGYEVVSSPVAVGSFALLGNQSASTTNKIINKTIPQATYSDLSFWYRQESLSNLDTANLFAAQNGGTFAVQLGISTGTEAGDQGSVIYFDGTSWQDTNIDITAGTYHKFDLSNIDYSNNQFDLDVSTASSSVGSASNLDFRGSANQVDRIRVNRDSGGTDQYWDEFTRATGSASRGQYISANHSVSEVDSGFTNLTLRNASATVEWQHHDGTSWQVANSSTFTSSGNHSLDISGIVDETWRVNVSFVNETGPTTAKLHDEGIVATTFVPTVDNSTLSPDDTSQTLDTTSPTLSVNASDVDFSRTIGDELRVEYFLNGNSEANETLTSNGTASHTFNVAAGDYDWWVVVHDQYGNSQRSATAEFVLPNDIKVWNETSPDELVKGNSTNPVEVTVRFYQDNNDTVIERSTTDGIVNMTGIPADERLTITVEAAGYHFRRITLDSLIQQQDVFVLSTAMQSAQVVFELDDRTGQFEPTSTRLYIQRAINKSNTTKYRNIAGDRFGASAEFVSNLQDDTRYRLRVENDDGQSRTLGAYTTSGDDRATLPIGRVTFNATVEEGVAFGASLFRNETASGTETYARVVYGDPEQRTDWIAYDIVRKNGSNAVVASDNITSPGTTSIGTYLLTPNGSLNATYEVQFTASRDGQTITTTRRIGKLEHIDHKMGVDPTVLKYLGYVAIVAITGLFAIISAPLAALGAVFMATLTTAVGVATFPPEALGFGGAVALFYNVARVKGVG